MTENSTQKEWRNKWVSALRSGKYQQARGELRNSTGYCCLGVLCDIVDSSAWHNLVYDPHVAKHDWAHGDGGYSFPGGKVVKLVGLQHRNGSFDEELWAEDLSQPLGSIKGDRTKMRNLSMLNDCAHWTFDQIADFIESEPEGMFEDV